MGEKIILGRVQTERNWSIANVLANPIYLHLRKSLSIGHAPWPDTCHSCAAFRPHEPFADGLSQKRILTLQIEPSLGCHLACPCCSQSVQIRERPKPYRMPLELFEALLASLQRENFVIREIEYCGQGEPLTHPQFREFVSLARKYHPQSRQRLITSGNFDYTKTLNGVALDRIYVSCDGLYQSSYEKYRVNGDVARVLKFMKDIPKEMDGRRQAVVWKYILFEFNDSEREIRDAREKALELGIDQLQFVFTHSKFKSARLTAENPKELKKLSDNLVTDVTPIQSQNTKMLRPLGTKGWPAENSDGIHFMIDEMNQPRNGVMHIRGWLLSSKGEMTIRLFHNEKFVCEIAPNEIRLDVFEDYPHLLNRNSGYSAEWIFDGKIKQKHHIEAIIVDKTQKQYGRFSRIYAPDEILEDCRYQSASTARLTTLARFAKRSRRKFARLFLSTLH